jgi:thiamine biosynthesis protein ThiI
MLVASLEPEIYLKSHRTQNRMLGVLETAIQAALGEETAITKIGGHRLEVATDAPDAVDRLSRVFGVHAVEVVERVEITDVESLAAIVADRYADHVRGKTFAVRPHRLGRHEWKSIDLARLAGSLLVEAGGSVDLSKPEYTVVIRINGDVAHLTIEVTPGVGGLPIGTQGRALMMFSGGIDSPVAAYLMAHRGTELDYLHFSFGCGEADHATGLASMLTDRYMAGSDPMLHVIDLEPAAAEIQRRVKGRERQMALKGVMYRCAELVARSVKGTRAIVNGESLGQVSTQTLENIAALDRLVGVPVLRPLIGLDKATITDKAREIGTFETSSRTRELCDISGGARVSVGMSAPKLAAITAELEDVIDQAMVTLKTMRIADWMPGS